MAEPLSCACGKVIYASRRDALTAVKRFSRPGRAGGRGHQSRPYRCEAGCWHLTTKPATAKTRRVQIVAGQDGVRDHRRHQELKRVGRFAKTLRSKRETPKPVVRLTKTRCMKCGRLWLSDIWPRHRKCPSCGEFDSYAIGTADRDKQWIARIDLA